MPKWFCVPRHVVFLVNEVPLFYGVENFPNLGTNIEHFEKILQCVNWCLKFGVEEITVTVFSCVIYKFSQEEIDKSMLAFRIVLIKWLNSEVFNRNGIRLNVIDVSLMLPRHISDLIRIIEELTKENGSITLNIIIGHAGEDQLNNLASNFPYFCNKPAEHLFGNCMLPCAKEPQLIVSNCKHRRLTDYLLWKTSRRCMLHFHTEWSKFKLLHFIAALFYFQFHPASRIVPKM